MLTSSRPSYMKARENKTGMWGEGGLEMSPSRYRDALKK
jgi:hypothetical protein